MSSDENYQRAAASDDAQESSTSQAPSGTGNDSDSQLSNSIKSLLETIEQVRSDLIELENKHDDAATVLSSQIMEKLGSLRKSVISLDKKYENTEHQTLFQEVFQRFSSVKSVLHDSLKPGSSTTIQEALHKIDELRMLLSQHSGISNTSRSPEDEENNESTRYQIPFQTRGASIDWRSERHEMSYSRQGALPAYDTFRAGLASDREPKNTFRNIEPQVARIDLNQDLENQVLNLKNEVNDILANCVTIEDTMISCRTTIAQNSRKLNDMENKVSSMSGTWQLEYAVAELSDQIETARQRNNELKNQLASHGMGGSMPAIESRVPPRLAIEGSRQELRVNQPTIYNLSLFCEVLDIHCNSVIAICKGEYSFAKRRNQNQNEEDLGSCILHHFLRIEANILKFQRIIAMRQIGKEVSEKKEHKTRSLSDRVVQFHRGGLLTDLTKICTELKTLRDDLNNKLSLRRMSFLYFSFENQNQELFLSGSTHSISDMEELQGIPEFVLHVLMDLEEKPRTVSSDLYRTQIDNFLKVLNK